MMWTTSAGWGAHAPVEERGRDRGEIQGWCSISFFCNLWVLGSLTQTKCSLGAFWAVYWLSALACVGLGRGGCRRDCVLSSVSARRPPVGSFGNPVPRTAAYVRTLTRAANAQECERVRSEGRGGREVGRVDCWSLQKEKQERKSSGLGLGPKWLSRWGKFPQNPQPTMTLFPPCTLLGCHQVPYQTHSHSPSLDSCMAWAWGAVLMAKCTHGTQYSECDSRLL